MTHRVPVAVSLCGAPQQHLFPCRCCFGSWQRCLKHQICGVMEITQISSLPVDLYCYKSLCTEHQRGCPVCRHRPINLDVISGVR